MSRSKGRLALPENPSLEQLREQAKERLEIIRSHAPEAQLSDAQFALARDYGFSGWRELKAEIDRRNGGITGLVGEYADTDISNNVLSVTAKGARLLYQLGMGAIVELIRQPDGAYLTPGLTRRYRFERDAGGKALALVMETESGAVVRTARISAEQAAQMRAEREQGARAQWRNRMPVAVPESALERCAGSYANATGQVIRFARDGSELFMETSSQTRIPLSAETEGDFFVEKARMELHFRLTGDAVTSVVVQRMGAASFLSRVSAEEATRLSADVERRAAEQAQPRQVAAPVAPDILARYVGRYRIESGMEVAITVEDGRIFAQMQVLPVIQPRQEIFPESDSKFFWTTRAGQISFFADAGGKVDYGVLHQGGHVMPIGRIAETPAQVSPAA